MTKESYKSGEGIGKRALVVFVRNLVPGQVKQRIAREVGEVVALKVYEELVRYLKTELDVLRETIEVVVYFSDTIDAGFWPEFDRELQRGIDLGQRMSSAISTEFDKGRTEVCLIGSDIPTLDSTIIQSAFDSLDKHDVVIGPASDGGYYLIGMKQPIPDLFTNIRWGSSAVFSTTTAKLDKMGLTLATLNELSDVDEWMDVPEEIREMIRVS